MRKKQRGMTLIELLIALVIGVVVLTLGVPSFQTMLRGNRATGQANELLGAIRLARSEAVKRGVSVSVCPRVENPDDISCDAAGNWLNGWLVFTDATGPGTYTNAAEELIRVWEKMEGSPTFNGTEPTFIRFNAQGGLHETSHPGRIDFSFKPDDCHGNQARRVEVEKLGAASITIVPCF